jgi:hypothetical protein
MPCPTAAGKGLLRFGRGAPAAAELRGENAARGTVMSGDRHGFPELTLVMER